jgi:hypothetical protein
MWFAMHDVTLPMGTVLFNPIQISFYFHKLTFSKRTTGIYLLLRFSFIKSLFQTCKRSPYINPLTPNDL